MRAIRDAFRGIFKHFWMSLASIIIMAACMLIMGSAVLIISNLNAFVVQMQKEDEVVVFIDENATEEQSDALEDQLRGHENVNEVYYVSQDEALKEYMAMFPDQEDMFDNLKENNPLRASYHIKIADLERYDETLGEIAEFSQVANIRSSSDVVNTLVAIRRAVGVAGMAIVAVLLFVSIFIVSNTIRMTIFARRTEISIMKYVGATDGYIRRPFVWEGVILGLVAFGMTYFTQWYVYDKLLAPAVNQLALFAPIAWSNIWWMVLSGFALFALLMGTLGSLIPMRKHLHV
ncbi:MAG: permease-like cell division protein FtsX [Clostridia bacterium]|nr:permease-like cell division protein FtsX [Clostridia bacterium]